MKKLQSVKQSVRRGLVGLLGSAILTSCSQGVKIEPIGWYDFNKDGTQDAIALVTRNVGQNGEDKPFYHKQLTWIDGRKVYDPDGVREFDFYGFEQNPNLHFGTGSAVHDLRVPYITDRKRGENPEYPRSARVPDVNGD